MFHLLLQAIRIVFTECMLLQKVDLEVNLDNPDIVFTWRLGQVCIQKKCSHVCDDYGDSFIDDTSCSWIFYCTSTVLLLKLSIDFK